MKKTYLLLTLNVLVFIFQLYCNTAFLNLPFNDTNYNVLNVIGSMFSHGSILHILNNLYILFLVGSLIEKLLGEHYLYCYLLSGIISCLITSLFYTLPSLGASGAIFGLLGAISALHIKDELGIIFSNIKFSIESFCNFNFYLSIIGSIYYIFTNVNLFLIAHHIHVIGFIVGYFYI